MLFITAMTTGKPNLLDVRRLSASQAILSFQISKRLFSLFARLSLAFGHLAVLYTQGFVCVRGAMPCIGTEPCATFVQGDGVSEVSDVGIRFGKRETLGNDANRVHGVPSTQQMRGSEKSNWTKKAGTNQTPTNSISTSMENAFLKAVLCFHPDSVSFLYIL
jgi:hypothetical protein